MKSKRKIINWILLISWMIFIFYMSNQPADISDSQSGNVIQVLTMLGIDVNNIFGELANFIVRKVAHFLEYMILTFLYFNVLKDYFKFNLSAGISVILAFIYACSDEFHQLFVSGREGAFRDVIIDTSGGIVIILLLVIIHYYKEKKKTAC